MVIPDAAPARLGRYELLARLATGGMGEIFLARLEGAAGFEKLYVIKRILPHLADDVRFRAMLIAEARIASMMAHPNVCQVYELGETEGQLYIVMEYLEGITVLPLLHKRSKEAGKLELGFVGGVIQQAVEGLHYAHELKERGGHGLGIVHRDVTPSNIFLTDTGIVKILDFGIAKVKDASAHTQTGTVKGKYAYMSPEQLRGAVVDRRADVFALGIVLFEMLALRRLFQRKTDYLTFRAVIEQPIPDVRHYRPDCPPALAAALARALDRDPDNRFASARQLGGAVLDAIAARERPWIQGEIGDFVRESFATDIQSRGEQIANAARTGITLYAIPLIAPPASEVESETEPDFPAVDSELSSSIVLGQDTATRVEPRAMQSSSQPAVVAVIRRNLVWPVVALAMVAIAAVALFMVWQQAQTPTSVVINADPASRVVADGSNHLIAGPRPIEPLVIAPPSEPSDPGGGSAGGIVDGADGGAAGAARKPGPSGHPLRPPQVPPSADYALVAKQRTAGAQRCVDQLGRPPAGTKLTITVGQDGQTKGVVIDPSSVEASPLGGCLKAVFDPPYPRGRAEYHFDVTLGSAGSSAAAR